MSIKKLNDRQETFCREYVIDFNATRAAIRAGYSESTSGRIGHENLKKLEIQNRVAELMQERNERNQIDADYVLRQAVKLHERCMQEVKPKMRGADPVIDIDDDGICSYVYEFNAQGAAKALELIGKHVDIQAFKDNVKHSGDIGITWVEQKTYETEPKTDTSTK